LWFVCVLYNGGYKEREIERDLDTPQQERIKQEQGEICKTSYRTIRTPVNCLCCSHMGDDQQYEGNDWKAIHSQDGKLMNWLSRERGFAMVEILKTLLPLHFELYFFHSKTQNKVLLLKLYSSFV
jgi:hypothetical protein